MYALLAASQARNLIADGAVKTKVKSSEFRFKPVKGWLGGEYTEKLEGWRARVFEVLPPRLDAVASASHVG